MIHLELNATSTEINEIMDEEMKFFKKNPLSQPAQNLVLLTDDEIQTLIELKKTNEFFFKKKKECENLERNIKKMLDECGIEYCEDFEGNFRCFYPTWIEDEGHTFNELLEMTKAVIRDYKYPIITFQILYMCFELKY